MSLIIPFKPFNDPTHKCSSPKSAQKGLWMETFSDLQHACFQYRAFWCQSLVLKAKGFQISLPGTWHSCAYGGEGTPKMSATLTVLIRWAIEHRSVSLRTGLSWATGRVCKRYRVLLVQYVTVKLVLCWWCWSPCHISVWMRSVLLVCRPCINMQVRIMRVSVPWLKTLHKHKNASP